MIKKKFLLIFFGFYEKKRIKEMNQANKEYFGFGFSIFFSMSNFDT